MSHRPVAALLLVFSLLVPAAAQAKGVRLGAKTPSDALDVPRFLGFDVAAHHRSIDVHGRPVSETTLAVGYQALHDKLHDLFGRNKPIVKGWSVQGYGYTTETGSISATLQAPDGLRFSLRGKPNAQGHMVLRVEGKAKPQHHPRMAEPVGDRTVR